MARLALVRCRNCGEFCKLLPLDIAPRKFATEYTHEKYKCSCGHKGYFAEYTNGQIIQHT
jgi:hypothetical protein